MTEQYCSHGRLPVWLRSTVSPAAEVTFVRGVLLDIGRLPVFRSVGMMFVLHQPLGGPHGIPADLLRSSFKQGTLRANDDETLES
jgi:hypothetical protein